MAALEDLLVDRAKLDRNLLAEVLRPFIGIDASKKEVVPKEGWSDLDPNKRILVFLLGRKAMAAMPDVGLATEAASPLEIEQSTGVKGGTLRPKLRAMKKEGLLTQDSDRHYAVPTHALLRVKQMISGGKSDGQRQHPSSTSRRGRPRKRRS